MKTGRARMEVLIACLVLGALTRLAAWEGFDGILPLSGLYVDEVVYASGGIFTEEGAFDRPPGQFLLTRALLPLGVESARAVTSVISMVPALLLAWSAGGRWARAAAIALSVEPSLALAGLQLLPEAAAAAIVSAAVALFAAGSVAGAGFLVGVASLFRPELFGIALLAPFSGLLRRKAASFSASALLPVLPVAVLNLLSGQGPVIASNGTENLWLGASPRLLQVPPGVEFEEMMAVGGGEGDTFLSRWAGTVLGDPPGSALFAFRKALACLELPGPGRNIDSRDMYSRTGLIWLVPVSAAALCLAVSRAIRRKGSRTGLEALGIACLFISAAVFFPSERYRAAFVPFIFLLAGSRPPSRDELVPSAGVAIAVLLCSFFPLQATRPGLNYMVRAGAELDSGEAGEALEDLGRASLAGFEGADMHNLRGIALAGTGDPAGALAEFESALVISPGAPTLWRNYAVALYSAGRPEEARLAASRAAGILPSLRDELAPLLTEVQR